MYDHIFSGKGVQFCKVVSQNKVEYQEQFNQDECIKTQSTFTFVNVDISYIEYEHVHVI